MDPGALEGTAESLYLEAGLDPSEPALQARLARALLGPSGLEIVPAATLRTTRARLAFVESRWRIFVRRGPKAEMAFGVAHELGHWALRREGYQDQDEELAADYIAGALIAPRAAFLRLLREYGPVWGPLADRLGTTESLVALRYGEVTAHPLALVRPGLVRVRSQLEFVWPDADTIRRWALGKPPTWLAKTRLKDDPRRVVLTGEDIDNVG